MPVVSRGISLMWRGSPLKSLALKGVVAPVVRGAAGTPGVVVSVAGLWGDGHFVGTFRCFSYFGMGG